MELENLKTFLTLSKLKNFTQTANAHFIVQSTVTNRILELEKELGKKLFIRDKKSVELTAAGNCLIPYAKRMIDLEASLTKDMNLLDCYTDLLRIGTVNTVYDCHLHSIFKHFIGQHTETATKVIIDHSATLFQFLQDGTVDLILTYLPFHHKNYICQPFRQDTLALVTHPSHTTYISGIRKEELALIPYLYCDFVFEEGESFIRDLFPPHFTFIFEIDRSTKLLDYLLDGIGYSFLPKSLVAPYIARNELIEIPLSNFNAPIIESYLTYKNQTSSRLSLQYFCTELQKDS